MSCFNHAEVGIFSRDDPTCYKWLIDVVESVRGVKAVHPVPITNSWNLFEKQVPKCSFAILYHSKTRGRINVTDVTDSLYDEELKYLSKVLGKERVIVVIDHLENSSEEEKIRILRNQPSLSSLASHLLLFNGGQGTEGAKLKSFKNLITRHACRVLILKFAVWLIFFLVVLFIMIIIIIVESSKHPGVESVTSTPDMPNITQLTTLNPTANSTSHMVYNTTHLAINTTVRAGG